MPTTEHAYVIARIEAEDRTCCPHRLTAASSTYLGTKGRWRIFRAPPHTAAAVAVAAWVEPYTTSRTSISSVREWFVMRG